MTLPLDLATYFSGAGLTFSAEGLPPGLNLGPTSGVISGVPTAAGSNAVTVTARNEAGAANAEFSWLIEAEAAAVAPQNSVAPAIGGDALVGGTLIAIPGGWTGAPTPAITRRWLRDGAAIPGATGDNYTLVAADDLRSVSLRETATNAAGAATASSASAEIRYPAPVAAGALVDRIFITSPGVQIVDASGDFSGTKGGVWSVSGAGATIDGNGLITIMTDAPLSGVIVTATYVNSGGSASSAFEVSVTSSLPTITVDSASLRFPEKNNTDETTGATRLLVPQFTGWANKVWGADGGFIARVSIPWRSYGRNDSSLPYLSKVANGVLGNSNTLAGSTSVIGVFIKAPSSTYATPYKVIITASGAANRTTELDIPLGTAPSNLTVCGRLVGSDLYAEVYSEGALIVSSGALGAPGESSLRGGILIGAVAGLGKTTPSLYTGHFHGSVGFFGWADATISKADMEAISAGADPYAQIPSGWRYAKKFTDETDLTPDYGGSYGDLTAVGTGFRKGGDIVAAASGTARFSVNAIPEGFVWGCAPGETTGTIRLSGKASGVTGAVEARYFNADGQLVMDWTTLTGSTIAAGEWAGTAISPQGAGWGGIDVRPASAPAMIQRIRTECGVGWKVALVGQSKTEMTMSKMATAPVDRTAPAGAVSAIVHQRTFSAELAGTKPQSGAIFMKPLTTLQPVADGVSAMSRLLSAYTDAPICIVGLLQEGTAVSNLLDDADPDRLWSDITDMTAICGPDLSLFSLQWNSGPISSALDTGGGTGNSINPLLDGDAPTGITFDVDHYLRDGAPFAADIPWVFGLSNRRIGGQAGPFNSSAASLEGAFTTTTAQTWYKQMRDYAVTEGFEYAFAPDTVLEDGGSSHSNSETPWGCARFGWRIAYGLARGLGLASDTFPAATAATRSGAAIAVTVTTPNGGTLQTGWSIAGETADADWPTVTPFEVSEDSGTTWSNGNKETGTAAVEFTAEITGANTVTLTRSTGTWATNTRVRYLAHGPCNFGAAKEPAKLVLGCLYEGDGDGLGDNPALASEGGIGLPVNPTWDTETLGYLVAS